MEGDRETVESVVEKNTRIRRNVWNIFQILQHQYDTGHPCLEGAGGAKAAEEEQDQGVAGEGHHLLNHHLIW